MAETEAATLVSRRDLLKLGGAAVAAGVAGTRPAGRPAEAQTPKRGGVFRIRGEDPVHFDPHQTISFKTRTMLSFTHSRLVKIKAGTAIRPGTMPLEGDLAESWSQ